MSATRIFTIPPQVAFTDVLAEGLLTESQQQKIPLVDFRLFLPTRRAVRALRAAFARRGGTMMLPQMAPLGDMDAEALAFAEAANGLVAHEAPPAIDPWARRFLLLQLVQRYDPKLAAVGAWQLADALAKLLDGMQMLAVPATALQHIVPAELAAHWQRILELLQIITDVWPRILAERGLVDPVTRHQHIVARQIALWQSAPPANPVIAAGSTASLPATADLLAAIPKLPLGLVILPGLDQAMPETVWEQIAASPTHPQHMMQQWLARCAVPRRAVAVWPYGTGASAARVQQLQTAFLPSAATGLWRAPEAAPDAAAFAGLSLLAAETQAEEAALIALKLRSVLATPARTAMLVTRDRLLAARVVGHLRRWAIRIDDSAGTSLALSPLGRFLMLVLAAAQREATPVDWLALLKHPLTGLGMDTAACRVAARLAEVKFWRGRQSAGTPLQQRAVLAAAKLPEPEQTMIAALLTGLGAALQPLHDRLQEEDVALTDLLAAHLQAAEILATTPESGGAARLWQDAAGEAAAELFAAIMPAAAGQALPRGLEYPALVRAWLDEMVVRSDGIAPPRLLILGPLEARLQSADCVLLGGLNEGVWPPVPTADPWLSRPMRRDCGLPATEQAIGQAAHDFVQLASRGEVWLTYARKREGQPQAPSRFLLRLTTLCAAAGIDARQLTPVEPWSDWARQLDAPLTAEPMPIRPPRPCPPVTLRPLRFAVTEIGDWRCNPYGFYAKHVLRLRAMAPLAPALGQSDFGTLVHRLLEDGVRALQPWPDTAAATAYLLQQGAAALAAYRDVPALYATWSAQWAQIADWFAETERERWRAGWQPAALEVKAEMLLSVAGRTHTLVGRVDRIDSGVGGYAVIDYKTGTVPSDKQVQSGLAPQLPLLGMMLEAGVFAGLKPRPISALLYCKLGGRIGGQASVALKDSTDLVVAARRALEATVAAYADPTMPYLVVPQPQFVPRFDDYQHLGRINEWGLAQAAEDGAEDDDAG